MQEKVYVITSTGTSGTGPTDECLREYIDHSTDFVIVGPEPERVPTFAPVAVMEPFDFRMRCPPRVIYDYWNIEGMTHMKNKHDQLRFTGHLPKSPNFHRRMEKRPYSGNCNLRF